MTNPNAPYAAQPQQSGFQPQPQFQPQQPYAPRPVAPLRTQRGLLKYVLLGLVTFSIYDIWQMSEVGDSLNLLAFKRDGKHTMQYCLMFFLVGWVTLGIGWLVWYHRVSGRIGEEQAARGLPVTVTASTFWLWGILGSLIAVGPFIYIYKLLHAMNACPRTTTCAASERDTDRNRAPRHREPIIAFSQSACNRGRQPRT